MKRPPSLSTPTLSEVQSKFAAWRKNKQSRHIPEELWEAAVMLSEELSVHKISTGLSLSHAELKKRIASTEAFPLEGHPLRFAAHHPSSPVREGCRPQQDKKSRSFDAAHENTPFIQNRFLRNKTH